MNDTETLKLLRDALNVILNYEDMIGDEIQPVIKRIEKVLDTTRPPEPGHLADSLCPATAS